MKIALNSTKNLLSAFTFLLCIISVNYSCGENRSRDSLNFHEESGIENVTIQAKGMDSIKLAEIPVIMQQFVNDKKIAGAVTLVVHNGQICSFEATGYQDIEKNITMQKNTVFRIASMSKPFAAASIMMLLEEGKLQLDDPVEKHLPEFHKMWLVSELTEEKKVLTQPIRPVTIRDILAHIDGLDNLPAGISVKSIAEYILVISQRPLLFEPGSEWRYGGSGITAAARIVEVISGQPYEDFLKKRIFIPLGMKNTSFSLPDESINRIAGLYHPSDDSGIEAIDPPDWWQFPRPEGGLLSTALDMSIWMQAFLNKGIYKDNRILNEESVIELTKIQTKELKTGFTDGMSFGLGFGIVRNPSGVTAMLSKGTFGHGGAFGTQYWADPMTNTIYILMIQRKDFGNGDASDIRNSFQRIASEAIIK